MIEKVYAPELTVEREDDDTFHLMVRGERVLTLTADALVSLIPAIGEVGTVDMAQQLMLVVLQKVQGILPGNASG